MRKGIILGNGINSRIGVDLLSAEKIRTRFIRNIRRYMPLFEASFDKEFEVDDIINRLYASKKQGIESLASIIYEYISNAIDDGWSINYDIRLQDLLTCMAITSIFLDSNGKIEAKYKKDKLPKLLNYDFIYTLNYYEFWDEKNMTKPLHGHIDLNAINSDTNMLVSVPRMNIVRYKAAVDELAKNNKIQVVDLEKIIFSPSTISKNQLICVEGLHPSDKLFLAEDLRILEHRTLYDELKEVDELDIFGMSPDGDDGIISIINTRKKVRVFVYNKLTNGETEKWKKKLVGDYDLLDSDEI